MRYAIISITLLLLAIISPSAQSEAIRDYYAEPGLNPFKNSEGQDFHENIDPFSGIIQHKYVDLVVPGNGGMDIAINRVYTSLQHNLESHGITGLGWTMHFGRIVVPFNHIDKICAQAATLTTNDNPSIEFPDGGRELLVVYKDNEDFLITKSNWKAECLSGSAGFKVTSPQGVIFYMDEVETVFTASCNCLETRWYTRRIVDTNGNTVDIRYGTFNGGRKYINNITTSDGREINFRYNNNNLLSEISANNQTWQYFYRQVEGTRLDISNYYHLEKVVRPDGLFWQYEYHPEYGFNVAGNYTLKTVTYPYGGKITYTYQNVWFANDRLENGIPTVCIDTKTTSGREIEPGTWSYEFAPGSHTPQGSNLMLDKTTITAPDGKYEYYHYGYLSAVGYDRAWTIGLLYEKRTFDQNNQMIEQVFHDWENREISRENYWHGRSATDITTRAPLLKRKSINRDRFQSWETVYENFDRYGNPQKITEYYAGQEDRVTNLTYSIDTNKWIVNKVKDETIVDVGTMATIGRTFDAKGNLSSQTRYGVRTSYTYWADGNIKTVTDANGKIKTYEDYFRGIPRRELLPESIEITRVVNPTGTVASETDGSGFTTNFTYDDLNRLKTIRYPINADVTIEWTDTGKTLTRGNYQEIVVFDGFGREKSVERKDVSGQSITITKRYNALGYKEFESYPNSNQGTTFTYDILGRVSKIEHPDGSFRRYEHKCVVGANRLCRANLVETNERGIETEYKYHSYGDPDNEKSLMFIKTQENATLIDRNKLNQPTLIFQGENLEETSQIRGLGRTFAYDSRYFLKSEVNPETGTTTYTYDNVGNMKSKTVGSAARTTYNYDGLNRVKFIDYPGNTPDVTITYDKNSNIDSITNANSIRRYEYDQNDNLTTETVEIKGKTYIIGYTYTLLDFLDTIKYPSDRQINYRPDALGRPTQASPYITGITYHPSGQIETINYANGHTQINTLNNRLWIERMYTSNIMDLTYGYDNIGNVKTITNGLNSSYNKNLDYDDINRLKTANGPWGNGTFRYDSFGNIIEKTIAGNTDVYTYENLKLRSITKAYNNEKRSFSYDTYGNIEYDSTTDILLTGVKLEKQYVYDAAGNLSELFVTQSETTNTVPWHKFGYDGNGIRVYRIKDYDPIFNPNTNVSTTHFVYAGNNNLLAEYFIENDYRKEYYYLGSQLIASFKENERPVANAGANQKVSIGEMATLDGSGSKDPDGTIASYHWKQLSGIPVSLSNPDSVKPTFIAPDVSKDEDLTFELTVIDDDGKNARDTVVLTVTEKNTPPVADAGSTQTVFGGQEVILDGSNSYDSDGISSYRWFQSPHSAEVDINDRDTPVATFISPKLAYDTVFQFRLAVTDPFGLTDHAYVNINIKHFIDTDKDDLHDDWEIRYFRDISLYGGTDDPDGDGVINSQEFEEKTNPHLPDSVKGVVKGVEVVPRDSTNIVIWDKVTSAIAYHVYWSQEPGVTKTTGIKISNVTSPFVHRGLTNGTTYYYVVTASNNLGETDISTEAKGIPGFFDIRLSTGDALTNNESMFPQISSNENGHVYVTWMKAASRGGVYFNYSSDYGVSWQTSDIPIDRGATIPHISSDGNGHVYVTWGGNPISPPRRGDIYFNYSSDYGATWLTSVIRLDTGDAPGAHNSLYPQISSDGNGHVYVTWMDSRNSESSNNDIYFNYSSDYGATWLTSAIRLDTGDAPGAYDSRNPQISSDGNGHVYVTWMDSRNSESSPIRNDIYFNYSSDYGETWQTSAIRLDTGDAPGAHNSMYPQISCDGNGHVYVTWSDNRNGLSGVYFNYSSDYGATWESSDILLVAGCWSGQITSDGNGHVYVVATGGLGWADIYFNYSSDYGVTWKTSAIRLDTGDAPGAHASSDPQISSDGNGHVYVTWGDERNEKENSGPPRRKDIYFNYSSDYGATWQASDIRLDTGDAPGAHDSANPDISSDGNGHVYVTWGDERNDFSVSAPDISDIYFNSLTIPPSSLQAYYTFDEGSGVSANDSSGNENHGTINGAMWTTGIGGGGLSFDGDDYVVKVNPSSKLKPSSQVAISVWIKTSATDTNGGEVVSMGDSYALRVKPDGNISFFYYDGVTWRGTTTAGVNVLNEAWHHVVGQKTSSALQIYVDGILKGSLNNTGTIIYTLGTDFFIGKHGKGSGNYDFKGIIDHIRIYNKELSSQDVLYLYNEFPIPSPSPSPSPSPTPTPIPNILQAHYTFDEGSGTTANDSSGNGYHGTINGAMWTTGINGEALSFDGINDYVDLGNPSGLQAGKVSLSAWFKTDASGGMILRKRLFGYGLEVVSQGKVSFWIYNAAATKFAVTSPTAYNNNTWHHAVGIYNGATVKLFIDGFQVASASAGNIIYLAGGIAIGRDGDYGGSYFKGLIDDVRIHNKDLNAQEILDLYRQTTGLISHWKLDEGSGTTVTDSIGGNNGVINGAIWTSGKLGGGLSLDGIDDNVQISRFLGQPQNITISAWANLSVKDTSGAEVISLGDHVAIRLDSSKGATGFYYDGAEWRATTTGISYAGTGWHHFVYVMDDTNNIQKVYVDGIEKGSTAYTQPISYTGLASNTFFGKHGNGNINYDFNGLIDDVRVYNKALSAQEVQELYNTFTTAAIRAFHESTRANSSNRSRVHMPGTTPVSPIAAMRSFKARTDDDGSIVLTWETVKEDNNTAFNLYRSRRRNGAYIQVNNAPINAKGNVVSGAIRSFEDIPPRRGAYYYKLEAIDDNGVNTILGPIKAKTRSGNNAVYRH